jgi:predicted enzyme related to lactoylglutathione lyase
VAEFTGYAAGTPCWVDIAVSDLDEAKRFYHGLFGWEALDQGPEAGGYCMLTLRGKNVAGLGPKMDPNQPSAWSTYVAVDDADATATEITANGGTVVMPPFDVLDSGRMTVCIDPAGAFFSLWQPKAHHGADLANEPGTLGWNELATRDPDGAITFYGAVFGWEANTMPMGATGSYTEWKLDGNSVGGMMPMGDHYPPQVPPHWLVYFIVDDCDASFARAGELGGTGLVPPTDIPPGRFAVIADPGGAAFAIMKMAQPA